MSSVLDGKQGEHIISLAFQVKDVFKILKTLPADMSYKVPVTSGIEIEFSAYGVKHMKEHFTITPHIEGVFKNYGKTVAFIPNQDLEYEKIYTITIDKSLEAKGYGPIHEDFEFRFETTPDPSTLRKNELYKKNRPRIFFKEKLLEVIPGKQPPFL